MRVELVYSDRGREVLIGLDVPRGCTVCECVERSGLYRLNSALRRTRTGFAVFGRHVEPDAPVSEGDRIEVLLPLEIDPKEARRARAVRRAADGPTRRGRR